LQTGRSQFGRGVGVDYVNSKREQTEMIESEIRSMALAIARENGGVAGALRIAEAPERQPALD
jgi:hypothetical protein